MDSQDSANKTFLSKYVKSRFSDPSEYESNVSSDELSAFGINPLVQSETSKRTKQMLDEAANEQTRLSFDD